MVYRFKASIPGSKVFMREYEIKPNTTLYKLHEFLVNDLEFAPDQMVAFKGLNSKGKCTSIYGLIDMGDGTMDAVTLEQANAKDEVILQYVYDMHNLKIIVLELIGETGEYPRVSYPRLVAQKGRNPDQFESKYEDYDQYEEPAMESSEDQFMDDELPEGEDNGDY